MEKETIRAEEAEANVEGLQNSIREEKIQQRQRVQHIFNENAELRERNEMLAKLLQDAKKEVKAISKALSAAEKKVTRAISLAAERKEEVWSSFAMERHHLLYRTTFNLHIAFYVMLH